MEALLKEGLIVMAMGMGTVFFFLVIMIYFMHATEKVLAFVNRFCPEVTEEKCQIKKKVVADNDADVAIAIACAFERSQKC